jgi:hypothetical protein
MWLSEVLGLRIPTPIALRRGMPGCLEEQVASKSGRLAMVMPEKHGQPLAAGDDANLLTEPVPSAARLLPYAQLADRW